MREDELYAVRKWGQRDRVGERVVAAIAGMSRATLGSVRTATTVGERNGRVECADAGCVEYAGTVESAVGADAECVEYAATVKSAVGADAGSVSSALAQ